MPDIRLAGTPQDYIAFGGSYTANTGNNRLVVAVVGYEHGTSSQTNPQLNMTLGSVPFTQIGLQIRTGGVSGGGAVGIAYIKEQNIPAGAQTISGTPNPGSAGGGYGITLYTLENVDQTVPIYNRIVRDTSVAPANLVSTISATAGGFAIVTGCSGTVGTQPFSTTDTTWTERRDYRNALNDFGFFIYDKFYTANKTENLKVDFSASGIVSSITVSFNAYVSNNTRPYSTVQAERLIETGKVKQFSDNFNRADTAIGDLGPNWDVITGALRIINNQFDGFTGGATSRTYAKVSESIVDFSDDHSAEITVAATRGSDFIGPAVRVTANGCYALYCDGADAGDRRIAYFTGTSARIVIGSVNIVPVAGDKLKLTAQGSTITAYKNGIQVDQISNTAWTTGQPGIFYDRTNVNGTKGDNFYAEDLNSPTSGTMVKMYDDGTIRAGYFSEKEYLDRIKYHYDGDVWAGKFIESE